jgi:hypothetical protein
MAPVCTLCKQAISLAHPTAFCARSAPPVEQASVPRISPLYMVRSALQPRAPGSRSVP